MCVVAHAGASGHRGVATTLAALADVFVLYSIAADVAGFVNGDLHCMVTAGGRIPRPFGKL